MTIPTNDEIDKVLRTLRNPGPAVRPYAAALEEIAQLIERLRPPPPPLSDVDPGEFAPVTMFKVCEALRVDPDAAP